MAGTLLKIPDTAHFFTLPEAAAYVRVCRMTMYRIAKDGRKKGGPPVKKIGGRFRFPREPFIEWANTADKGKV